MDSGEMSPEMIAVIRKLSIEKAFCQQTNLSYYQNALVHCVRPATHVISGEEHWGVETDGTERGWDL